MGPADSHTPHGQALLVIRGWWCGDSHEAPGEPVRGTSHVA